MNLIHIADLRVFGGVESMLVNFILATPHIHHHLVLNSKFIHKSLQADLCSVKTISSSKHFLGLPLPKKIRAKNRARIINGLHADKVLVWNQVVDLSDVKIPCIYYEHGSAWYEHTSSLQQKCFGLIEQVIAVSYAAKRMLQLKYSVVSPIVVKHNVLFSKVAVSDEYIRALPTDRPIILGSAGRLVSGKCLALLVLVIYELQQRGYDVYAQIAGCGDEEDSIRNLIAAYGLCNKIELLGFVHDMKAFYQSIDVYICTSIHESFGLTCLEAAAFGLPVIAANVDGLPEVIEHEVTGFCLEPTLKIDRYVEIIGALKFDSKDIYFPSSDSIGEPKILAPIDIAEQIIFLLKDPERYKEMSHHAFLRAKNTQNFTNLCQDILMLCEMTG